MSYPTTLDELRPLAHRELCKAIETFGLQTESQDLVIRVVGTPFQVLCDGFEVSQEGRIVSLRTLLALGVTQDDPVIAESVAGFGADFEAALGSAAVNWVLSIFLAALAWHSPDSCPAHMANSERHTFKSASGQSRVWRVISSPLLSQGGEETSDGRKPVDVQALLQPLFAEIARDEKPHWVKAFMAFMGEGEIGGDCTVDNQTSERGKQLLFSAKAGVSGLVVRQFFILWPDSEAVAEPVAKRGFWSRFKPSKLSKN